MYVIVTRPGEEEVIYGDVSAVVIDSLGLIRLCWEGEDDDSLPKGTLLVVTP